MQIETGEQFVQQLESAIAEIGRENAKVLSAQIKSLVEHIKSGDTEKTILLWAYDDAPDSIRRLVDETYPERAIWIVLYPIGYHGDDLILFHGGNRVFPHLVKIPLQKLVAYF